MRFLTDVDEVLADFVGPAVEAIRRVHDPNWTFDDAPIGDWDIFGALPADVQEAVWAILDAPGHCASLRVLDGAQEFIKALKELCQGNVYACTSPGDTKTWVYERERWLGKHFDIGRDHIIHAECKYVCGGDFLLDDKPGHVITWQQEHPNGVGMLWTTEHNTRLKGHDGFRVRSYAEVIKRVEMRI